jgi:hypothetical protein
VAAHDKPSISINAKTGRVTFAIDAQKTVATQKASQFICALIDHGPERDVTGQYLERHLPRWRRNKARDSARKSASRCLDELEYKGIHLVDRQGRKTGPWSIRADLADNISDDTKEKAGSLIRQWNFEAAHQFKDVALRDLVSWLSATTEAILHLTTGTIDQSATSVAKAKASANHRDLDAIANVISARIDSRTRASETTHYDNNFERQDVFALAVNGRRLAAAAVGSVESQWDRYLEELHHAVGAIIARADTTTMAVLFNAMAVLCRRRGDKTGEYGDALTHIREAAPLAILSGDLTLIQAVAFNFGHILTRFADDQAFEPELQSLVTTLIGIDIGMRERHGIGNDSAQAELVLARSSIKSGEIDVAKVWLARAHSIIEVSQQDQDIALFEWTKGRIMRAEALSDQDRATAAQWLKSAAARYRTIGRMSVAAKIEKEAG